MRRSHKGEAGPLLLGAHDWHVLVALERERLHGYAIMQAVAEDSGGAVRVELGSLYRVLGRLMASGLVSEVAAPPHAPSETRGRPRRYYELTADGRAALRQEVRRMRDALDLARRRRLVPRGTK